MAEREGSIVKKGKEALRWIISLYEQYELPSPFQELVEVGFVERTGYMWVLQEKRIEHKFKMIGKLASDDAETSGYLEKRRIRKLRGVKARELVLWTPCTENFVMTRPLGRSGSKPLAASPLPSPFRPLPRLIDCHRRNSRLIVDLSWAFLLVTVDVDVPFGLT